MVWDRKSGVIKVFGQVTITMISLCHSFWLVASHEFFSLTVYIVDENKVYRFYYSKQREKYVTISVSQTNFQSWSRQAPPENL